MYNKKNKKDIPKDVNSGIQKKITESKIDTMLLSNEFLENATGIYESDVITFTKEMKLYLNYHKELYINNVKTIDQVKIITYILKLTREFKNLYFQNDEILQKPEYNTIKNMFKTYENKKKEFIEISIPKNLEKQYSKRVTRSRSKDIYNMINALNILKQEAMK